MPNGIEGWWDIPMKQTESRKFTWVKGLTAGTHHPSFCYHCLRSQTWSVEWETLHVSSPRQNSDSNHSPYQNSSKSGYQPKYPHISPATQKTLISLPISNGPESIDDFPILPSFLPHLPPFPWVWSRQERKERLSAHWDRHVPLSLSTLSSFSE